MWRLFLALSLVLTSNLVLSRDVKFKHNYYGNSSTLWMGCTFSLSHRDVFNSLNITKDKQLFYSYDNSTTPKFQEVSGIDAVTTLSTPGSFVIPRINKTTEGKYKCSVYYTEGHRGRLKKESDDFKIEIDDLVFEKQITGLKDHMNVHLSCVPHLKPNQRFERLTISKGRKKFYSYDTNYDPKFTPIHGITSIEMQGLGVFVIRDVKRRHVKGKYYCKVYYNGNHKHEEKLHVNKSGITNVSKKLFAAIIGIFVMIHLL